MAVYLIADSDWKGATPNTIQTFARMAQPAVLRYGGKVLTVPRRPEVLEGDWTPALAMILEFPDAAALQQFWADPDYRTAATFRQEAGAVFKIVTVEGVGA